jgi:hypothetical protein
LSQLHFRSIQIGSAYGTCAASGVEVRKSGFSGNSDVARRSP